MAVMKIRPRNEAEDVHETNEGHVWFTTTGVLVSDDDFRTLGWSISLLPDGAVFLESDTLPSLEIMLSSAQLARIDPQSNPALHSAIAAAQDPAWISVIDALSPTAPYRGAPRGVGNTLRTPLAVYKR